MKLGGIYTHTKIKFHNWFLVFIYFNIKKQLIWLIITCPNLFLPSLPATAGFESRFQKEANMSTSAIHPSVVKVIYIHFHFGPIMYSSIWGTLAEIALYSPSKNSLQNTCRRIWHSIQHG